VTISAALATCGSGNQNAKLPVMVCVSPTSVSVGQTWTLSVSGTNLNTTAQNISVAMVLFGPNHDVKPFGKFLTDIHPNQPFSLSVPVTIRSGMTPGTYTLVGTAVDSSATASKAVAIGIVK
jgi:hypothetical protein